MPDARGREIARNAAHAEAIGPVGCHLDVDDRLAEPDQIGILRADRRVGRQFDDAGVILALRQLCRRHQHSLRGDAADRSLGQRRAGLRDAHPGRAEHSFHAGPRIWRAAHDLHLAGASIDDADPEPVGIGVRLGADDFGDNKAVERCRAVLDAVDIVAEHDEPLDDRGERRLGVEMRLEPAERGFHTETPRTSEGMSSGTKP